MSQPEEPLNPNAFPKPLAVTPLGVDETGDFAETLIDDMSDRHLRNMLRDARDRRGLAMVAANITEDRYGAGSTAARAVLYVLLTHGHEAAKAFVADLEHHEH